MRNGRNDCARTGVVRLGILCLGLAIAIPASSSAEARIGVNQATLEWNESSGLVDGYLVYTRRNGNNLKFEGTASENRFTVEGDFDDEFVVQVKALGRVDAGAPLTASDFSEPSAPIRFIPPFAWDSPVIAVMPSQSHGQVRMLALRSPTSPWHLPGRGAPWIPIAVGYFTEDAFADMVWQHADTGALEITGLAHPDTTLSANDASDLPNQELRAIGDVDGDGDQDLVMYDTARDLARIWRVAGDGSLRRSTRLSDLAGSEIVAAADYDGDGDDDVWTLDLDSNRVRVYRGNGSGPIANAPIAPFERVERIADFDDDGYADVLWRTQNDGFAMTYLGANAQTLDTVVFPGAASDSDLEVVGVAPLLPNHGLEVILTNRVDGSLWTLFPNIETSANRFKILDTNDPSYRPLDLFY